MKRKNKKLEEKRKMSKQEQEKILRKKKILAGDTLREYEFEDLRSKNSGK